MIFYLGTHHPHWLGRLDVPLFISRNALARVRRLPRARGVWALDSGGFSELSAHGAWIVPAATYAAEAARYQAEIGGLAWAAPQDWMCEPQILKRTGLDVAEHQRRTIANFLQLRELAPGVPWAPVLQGWTLGEYYEHAEAYEAAGVDLRAAPIVGVGTVCRRQQTIRAGQIMATLAADGLRLHGFGFKVTGLRASSRYLASADSLAWSENARHNPPLPGHTHKACNNCQVWALEWRRELLESLPT